MPPIPPNRLYRLLKPGGRIVITDYCKAPGEPSAEFAAYIASRRYDVREVEEYGEMLRAAGFVDVAAMDKTDKVGGFVRREVGAAGFLCVRWCGGGWLLG
jgi:phosphoethanolamine N-methyltransferase